MVAIVWSILLTLFRFLLADQMWAAVSTATMANWPAHQVPFVVNQQLRHAVVAGDNVVVLSGNGNAKRLVNSTSLSGDKTIGAQTRAGLETFRASSAWMGRATTSWP